MRKFLNSLTAFRTGQIAKKVIYFRHLQNNFPLKLRLLDEISQGICEVADNLSLMELLTNEQHVHDVIEKGLNEVNHFLEILNGDNLMYNSLLEIKYNEKSQFLSPDESEILNTMIYDFEEKYRIFDSKPAKKRFFSLVERERVLKSILEENIIKNREIIPIDGDLIPLLPLFQKQRVILRRNSKGKIEARCSLNQLLSIICSLQDDRLKKILFSHILRANVNNREIISELMQVRNSFPRTGNFSDFTIRNSSLTGQFLTAPKLIDILKNHAKLVKIQISEILKGKPLNIADLLSHLVSEEPKIKDFNGDWKTLLINFFRDFAMVNLYWKESIFNDVKQIEFLVNNEENNQVIGHIIIPLIAVQGVTRTMIVRSNYLLNSNEYVKARPMLYLIFDFLNENSQSKLTAIQVKAVIHEMTHAIHNILSFHDYQYITSNTPLDFAESMAMIFEKTFVQRHFSQTKDSELRDAVSKLEQIYYALIDLYFHREFFPEESMEKIANRLDQINTDLFHEIFGREELIKTPINHYCSMPHLATYPSQYYSYPLGIIFFENLNPDPKKIRKLIGKAHKKDEFYEVLREVIGEKAGQIFRKTGHL